MAVTKKFLTQFSDFVTSYKRNATTTYLSWSKEPNHEKLIAFFEELNNIIVVQQEWFNDCNIIEHVNKTVLLSTKSNPYLLDCWAEFIRKYYAANNDNSPFENNSIKILPEGSMLSDLQAALSSSINTNRLTQIAHTSETEKLRKQVQELTETNKQLQSQISQQELKIRDQEQLLSMLPRIVEAPKHLFQLHELLMDLREVIATDHNTHQEPKQKVPDQPETVSALAVAPPKAQEPAPVSSSTNDERSPESRPSAQKITSSKTVPTPPTRPTPRAAAAGAQVPSNLGNAINAQLALWKNKQSENNQGINAPSEKKNGM